MTTPPTLQGMATPPTLQGVPTPTDRREPMPMPLTSTARPPWPTPADLRAATRTHKQGHFQITSRKMPISKTRPIEELEKDLKIRMPEMIFGDNLVSIKHLPTRWRIEFSTRDALDAVDKTGDNMLQVAYAEEWSASREQTSAGIREVVRPFDWSYSTKYSGTVVLPSVTEEDEVSKADTNADTNTDTNTDTDADVDGTTGTETEATTRTYQTGANTGDTAEKVEKNRRRHLKPLVFTPTNEPIPIELLKRRDPIRFFDDVMLYESELDDNGISAFSAKIRVHDERMLLLCRLYMRLDNVVCRIRDTRIYVDFATETVTREYTAREAKYHDIKQKLLASGLRPDGITVAFRDANRIVEFLPVIQYKLESVSLGE
ncbi:type 2A phosphatase activator TIP41 [Nemania sp. NC0429]|nr:type 2A phosphatase activator TIP41 [Nemania sp. NC0429]